METPSPKRSRRRLLLSSYEMSCTKLASCSIDMSKPRNKGYLFEAIVREIEQFVLRRSPALREPAYNIETRKIILVDGVHHEIDVYVTINAAEGYNAIHIFECKNLNRPVDKNEVVTFSEKVKAVGAAQGVFVARSYTSGARAQAKKDSRLRLLVLKEHEVAQNRTVEGPNSYIAFHAISIHFTKWGEAEPPEELGNTTHPIIEQQVVVDGKTESLADFCLRRAYDYCSVLGPSGAFNELPDGTYRSFVIFENRFRTKKSLVYEGASVRTMQLRVDCRLELYKDPLWHFELESRGSIKLYAPVVTKDGSIQQFVRLSEIS